jgi:hypothetical protein
LARAEIAASAASLAAAFDVVDVAIMLWHCITRGLVGAAHPLAPACCSGRFADGLAVEVVNCPKVAAPGGVAAAAGPELASPDNVKAAAARHAPTVAYNLKRKVNSPETRDTGSCRAQRPP